MTDFDAADLKIPEPTDVDRRTRREIDADLRERLGRPATALEVGAEALRRLMDPDTPDP